MSTQLALQEIEKMVRAFKAFDEAKTAIAILSGYEQNKKELEQAIYLLKEEQGVQSKNLDKIKDEVQQTSVELKNKADEDHKKYLLAHEAEKEQLSKTLSNIRLSIKKTEEQEESKIKTFNTIIDSLNQDITSKTKEISFLENQLTSLKDNIKHILQGVN